MHTPLLNSFRVALGPPRACDNTQAGVCMGAEDTPKRKSDGGESSAKRPKMDPKAVKQEVLS